MISLPCIVFIFLSAAIVLALPAKVDADLPDWTLVHGESATKMDEWEFVKHDSDLDLLDKKTSKLPILDRIRRVLNLRMGLNTPADNQVARATLDELAYLDPFRYYNARVLLDELLAQLLVRDVPGVDKSAVYRAVEDVREKERVSFGYRYPHDLLVESLKPVLKDVKNPGALVARLRLEARADNAIDINHENLPISLNDYNDDSNMDDLVASLLAQGEHADPEAFKIAVGQAYRRLASEKSLLPHQLNLDNFEEHLAGILKPEFIETLKFRETLQVARRMIKPEKSNFATPGLKPYDDDTQMADLLIPLLKGSHDIRNIMRQAREAVTLAVAVQERKLFALRKLLVFGVTPREVVHHLVRQTVHAKDSGMLAILLPYTSLDLFASLLLDAVKTAMANQANVVQAVKEIRWEADSLLIYTLLADHRATQPTINKAYEYASIGDGKVTSVFWNSGRIRKEE